MQRLSDSGNQPSSANTSASSVIVTKKSWTSTKLDIMDSLLQIKDEKGFNDWNNAFIMNVKPNQYTKDQMKQIAYMIDIRREQLKITVE